MSVPFGMDVLQKSLLRLERPSQPKAPVADRLDDDGNGVKSLDCHDDGRRWAGQELSDDSYVA